MLILFNRLRLSIFSAFLMLTSIGYADPPDYPCGYSFTDEESGITYEVESEETIDGSIITTIVITNTVGKIDFIYVERHSDGTVTISYHSLPTAVITTEYDANGNKIKVTFWPDKNEPDNKFEYEGDKLNNLSNFVKERVRRGQVLLNRMDFSTCPPVERDDFPLVITLNHFNAIPIYGKIIMEWKTNSEFNNIGSRIWRGIEDSVGNYKVTLLRESNHSKQINPESNKGCSTKIQGQLEADNSSQPSKLISAIGNSAESTCYSFTDTSDLSDGTYYYLLEDIGDNGDSTFHCDQIDAVAIGQGPAIDLESAINYCKEVTGSNN
ncbi:MAG: hypothetical protein HC877_22740 [Thioploca sp.]|nr:hypothetical protein [Thioploca sp.]